MDGLRIIPVTNEELVLSVSAVAEDIWREHYTPILGEKQVDYMLEKFLSPEAIIEQIHSGYEYILFSFEYTFAGFMAIHEEDGKMFLSKLYVHEEFRGKGIGSHMFQQAIAICQLRNIDTIWLTCNRNNTNTLSIYEHLGFVKTREEVADIGSGYVMDDYILEYKIK